MGFMVTWSALCWPYVTAKWVIADSANVEMTHYADREYASQASARNGASGFPALITHSNLCHPLSA